MANTVYHASGITGAWHSVSGFAGQGIKPIPKANYLGPKNTEPETRNPAPEA